MERCCVQVYKGVYGQSTMVAIKTLKYDTQKDMEEALYEVAILKKQLHPNILQFLGACILVHTTPPPRAPIVPFQVIDSTKASQTFKTFAWNDCEIHFETLTWSVLEALHWHQNA